MGLELEQAQHQGFSQKMVQSVNILGMSTQELAEYIKQMALENPLIDFSDERNGHKEEERIRKLEWLEELDEQNRVYYQYDKEDEENDAGINNVSEDTGESLGDFLKMQLLGKSYFSEEQGIFEYIIANLDVNGYFVLPVPEVAEKCGVSEERVQKCLRIMHTLEPVGVCAKNLQECLILQLKKQENSETGITIVKNYLDLLGKNQLHVIAQKMQIPLEKVAESAEQIRSLNPKPARGFDNGEWMHYIVPDITVVKFSDQFEILLNDYACPPVRLNRNYMNMLKSGCDKNVKEYLLHNVKRAEELQKCIAQRKSTLMELAKCILDVQQHFFRTGDKILKPFRMKDAAEQMGCHESTVSRAVKDKYLQCCWGVFPLSFFFQKSAGGQQDGGSMAAAKVKEMLKTLIDREEKEKPYSDQKLAEMLKEEGVDISRRTVVKYREEMMIPNSRERKIYGS